MKFCFLKKIFSVDVGLEKKTIMHQSVRSVMVDELWCSSVHYVHTLSTYFSLEKIQKEVEIICWNCNYRHLFSSHCIVFKIVHLNL